MTVSPNDILRATFHNERTFASGDASPFKLYPQDSATFRFADYGILLKEATGKKRALEFGPGNSTWALVEAGCEHIVTCEFDPEWREVAKEKFKDYPQVQVIPFEDEPEAKADISGEFDIAFVDSPKGYKHQIPGVKGTRKKHPGQEDCSRFNTCVLALKHAPLVLLHDAARPLERGTLGRLSAMGHKVRFYKDASHAGMARIERDGAIKT